MKALGLLALVFYAIHGGYYLSRGLPEGLLWACHLGCVLVGVGLILGSSKATLLGVLWLVLGNVMWVLDLATGGEFLPTSLFTHVGGLTLGLIGLHKTGMPEGRLWWQALLGIILLSLLCRWVTSPGENVNLAHAVQEGWEGIFPSYYLYFAVVALLCAVFFLITESILRRTLKPCATS